ncbi:MAG TPA: hypothetical protein VGN98_02000, partial [Tianweitania sediminis]|nr:hypothetical protein [Tianweitania sediminis]
QELAQIVSAPVPEAQAKLGGVSPASVYRMRQQVNGRRPPKPRIPDLNKHLEKYGFDAARAVVRTAPTLEDAAAQLDIGATSIYKAMNILGVERPDRSDYRPDGWSKSGKRAATEAEIAPAQTAPEEELADKPKRKRIGRLDKHLAGFTDEDLRVIIGAAETLTEAAQFLGIGDSTIYSVLKRLGIDPKTKTWGNK